VTLSGEERILVVSVLLGLVLSVAVSAVVGAVLYAGWMEPGSRPEHECVCCS
jgi:hypothetical protein